jgi:hypothetical protein
MLGNFIEIASVTVFDCARLNPIVVGPEIKVRATEVVGCRLRPSTSN